MWPAFLIGLLTEFFNESKEWSRLVLKGLVSGVVGIVLNLVLLLLISENASRLIGYEVLNLGSITLAFVLAPFIAAFVALTIVKTARYLSTVKLHA